MTTRETSTKKAEKKTTEIIFEYVEKKPVEDDFICPVCLSPLVNPVEHSCGRMLCKSCWVSVSGCFVF